MNLYFLEPKFIFVHMHMKPLSVLLEFFCLQKTTKFIMDSPSSVSVNNLSLLCSILTSWMRFHINYLKNYTCHWMKVFSNEYLQPFLNKNPTVGNTRNNIQNVHTILTSIELIGGDTCQISSEFTVPRTISIIIPCFKKVLWTKLLIHWLSQS